MHPSPQIMSPGTSDHQKTVQSDIIMAEDDEIFPTGAVLPSRQGSEDSASSNSDSGLDSDGEGETDLEIQKTDLSLIHADHLSLVDDDVPLLVPQNVEMFGEIEECLGEEVEAEAEADVEVEKQVEPLKLLKSPSKEGKKKKIRRRKKWMCVCLANCKYELVRHITRKMGFHEVNDTEDWVLYWTDCSVALQRVMDMKRYQKINHFPGMNEICRKDLLARNMTRMLKIFPKEYNIFPKTWCLPADFGDLQAFSRQRRNKAYILKPEAGSQGKGIFVTKNIKDIKPHEHMICQLYISKPFLIDGFKFDFRIYVLITSCDPLRIFVFKDGLTRFATCKYNDPTTSNTNNVYMHLTNYAINKHSDDFVRDDEAGSKRRISTVNRYLAVNGYNVEKLWQDIDDVIIKTVISAHNVLRHNYRTCFPSHTNTSACFEILGLDILVDKKLKPMILEVNHSPSFNTDSPLDKEIKSLLVTDSLALVNFGAADRRKCTEEERKRVKDRLLGRTIKKESKEEQEVAYAEYIKYLEIYENKHLGNFRRIYPTANTDKYDKFFQINSSLFQETLAFKVRSELARQMREGLMKKETEKNSLFLRGKKKNSGGNSLLAESPQPKSLHPESPMPKKTPKRTSYSHTRRLGAIRSRHDPATKSNNKVPAEHDSSKPMDILDDEEYERLRRLNLREILVRKLGVADFVHRLLNTVQTVSTPINTQHKTDKPPLLLKKCSIPATCNYSTVVSRNDVSHNRTNLITLPDSSGYISGRSPSRNSGLQQACSTNIQSSAGQEQRLIVTNGQTSTAVTYQNFSRNPKQMKKPTSMFDRTGRGYSLEYGEAPDGYEKDAERLGMCCGSHVDIHADTVLNRRKRCFRKDIVDFPRFHSPWSQEWSQDFSVISTPAPLIYKCDLSNNARFSGQPLVGSTTSAMQAPRPPRSYFSAGHIHKHHKPYTTHS